MRTSSGGTPPSTPYPRPPPSVATAASSTARQSRRRTRRRGVRTGPAAGTGGGWCAKEYAMTGGLPPCGPAPFIVGLGVPAAGGRAVKVLWRRGRAPGVAAAATTGRSTPTRRPRRQGAWMGWRGHTPVTRRPPAGAADARDRKQGRRWQKGAGGGRGNTAARVSPPLPPGLAGRNPPPRGRYHGGETAAARRGQRRRRRRPQRPRPAAAPR